MTPGWRFESSWIDRDYWRMDGRRWLDFEYQRQNTYIYQTCALCYKREGDYDTDIRVHSSHMMTKGGASGWCCLSPNHIRVRLLIFFFLLLFIFMLLFLSASSWQQFLMSLISPGLLTDCISTLVYNDGIVSRLASSAGLVIWGEVVKDDNNSSIQTTPTYGPDEEHETVCISIVYRYISLCWIGWQIVCLDPCFVCATSENSIRHPIRTLTFAGYFSIVYIL